MQSFGPDTTGSKAGGAYDGECTMHWGSFYSVPVNGNLPLYLQWDNVLLHVQ